MVVTDTWVSMGQEPERAQRLAELEPYRLDAALLAPSQRCVRDALPAGAPRRGDHRGGALRRPVAIWDEAENRLHVQKALLTHVLGELNAARWNAANAGLCTPSLRLQDRIASRSRCGRRAPGTRAASSPEGSSRASATASVRKLRLLRSVRHRDPRRAGSSGSRTRRARSPWGRRASSPAWTGAEVAEGDRGPPLRSRRRRLARPARIRMVGVGVEAGRARPLHRPEKRDRGGRRTSAVTVRCCRAVPCRRRRSSRRGSGWPRMPSTTALQIRA